MKDFHSFILFSFLSLSEFGRNWSENGKPSFRFFLSTEMILEGNRTVEEKAKVECDL